MDALDLKQARETVVRAHIALTGLGIARDPTSTLGRIATLLNHPITMTRALLRGFRR
jgi:hypothetical protein